MKRFTLQNIRVRLTAWNILVFGSILAVYAFGTTWFFLSTLSNQLDASLMEELELVEQMLFHLPEGEYFIDTHDEQAKRYERFIELWSSDARLLYRSKMLAGRALGGPPDSSEFGGVIRSVALDGDMRFRVASKLHTTSSTHTLVRLAVNEEEYLGGVYRFFRLLLFGIPLGLILVSLSAYLLARNALRPIDSMVATAQRISGEALHERIPVENPADELGRLALTFNGLLERVEQSFQQLRRFTSDASHQLRTPLTAMRTVGEVGLQTHRTPEEYRDLVGSMLEESNRLTHLVDSLLFLSRADAGKHVINPVEIDALEFTRETGNMMRILAEEKGQRLDIVGKPGIIILADRTLMCQALLNVVDNAIKFSPENGVVTIHVEADSGQCRISITDTGPGIPSSLHERVFERFFKGGKVGTPGSGLGLAIARWAIEANGGTIRVDAQPPRGATFLISIPLKQS